MSHRPSQLTRNLASIKTELKLLLATLDPVSAFTYLQNEGLVTPDDGARVDQHIATRSRNTFHAETKQERDKKATCLRSALLEIVDEKQDGAELRAIVLALSTFRQLHKSVQHRHTVANISTVSVDSTSPLLPNLDNEESFEELPSHPKPGSPADSALLAALEEGTHNKEQISKLLEDSKDRIIISDVVNFEGKTLLHLACCRQPVDVVRMLVSEYSCDPNAQDIDGNTCLHDASCYRKPTVIHYLAGLPNCDINILNNNNETALHVALSKEHWRLAKVLLKYGRVDPSLSNSRGESYIDQIERHPQPQERAKLRKLLNSGNTSVVSNVSATDLEEAIELHSARNSVDKKSLPRSVSSNASVKATLKKGILRPFNPESIRTSQMEINIEKGEGSSAHLVNCTDACLLISKVGLFMCTFLLCGAVLFCLIYFLLTSQ